MFHRSRTHLRQADESYWEHLSFAATFGFMAISAGIACLIHAILPSLCTNTASRTIGLLNELAADRNRLEEIRERSLDAIAFTALISAACIIAIVMALTAMPAGIVIAYGALAFGLPAALLLSNPNLEPMGAT